MQIGQDIWVKTINLVMDLKLFETTVTVLRLKEKLLKENLADYREDCLENLKGLCLEAGIEVPKVAERKLQTVKKRKQPKPEWAFLDETETYSEVYFCAAHDPRQFYVKRAKYQDL